MRASRRSLSVTAALVDPDFLFLSRLPDWLSRNG